jgi:hypothetical protein
MICQGHNLGSPRAFADAQEARDGGSHKEGDDQKNDHELHYREKVLNVFMTHHSCKKTHIGPAFAVGPWAYAVRREILLV